MKGGSRKAQCLKHLRDGRGIVSYACDKIGISRVTYYNWYHADEKFKTEADEIQEIVVDLVESKLLKKINDEDTTSIIFYLKTKGKKRGYVEQSEIKDVSDNPWISLAKKSLYSEDGE